MSATASVLQPNHVLLIRPPDAFQSSSLLSHTRPMNLAYLAATLRTAGFDIRIIDYETSQFSEEHLGRELRQFLPAVVGFSSTTPAIGKARALAATVKTMLPGTSTVVGGAHANALPEDTLREFPLFDYLVFGEGELTMLELCVNLRDGGDISAIKGIVFRDGDAVRRTEERPLAADLDSLPFPARDLIDCTVHAGHSNRGFSNRLRYTELFTSRGCPVGCSFCAVQATFGRTVRFRDPLSIEEEISSMMRDCRYDHLVIADDTFTLDQERAAVISEIIGRSGISSWNCDTRVNTVSLELLKLMRQCGCRKVAFGVESGSQRLLDAVGKNITVDQVRRAVLWAKQAGMDHIEGNFIIGSDPSETADDLEQTRELIRTLPWTFISVAIIVPYPGTPVRKKMISAGFIEPGAGWDDYVIFGSRPRWRTEHFSPEQLLALQRSITREYYLRPGYVFSRLRRIRSFGELGYWVSSGTAYLRWYFTGKT